MKNIIVVIMLLAIHAVYAHNVNYDTAILREWNIDGNKFRGSFLSYKNDSVFIENEKQKAIGFSITQFNGGDKVYISNKIDQIASLNIKLDDNIRNSNSLNPFYITGLIFLAILIFLALYKNQRQNLKYIIPFISVGISAFLLSFTDPNIIRNAFLPFAPDVNTFWDNNYFYVESKGIPVTHEMMVGISNHGWQQQVPIPQCYIGNNAWSIPLNPAMATNPVPIDQIHFTRGAIAIAVNGVPIFNPYTNTGVDAYLDGQLDNYGGHCGRGDDYHYHTAPLHLYNQTSSTLPIAYAFDGFAVYGNLEPDGTSMATLDANHGHTYNGVYHYHGTANAPYMIAKFAGVVTEDATHQLIPQAHASPVRTENWTPLNGALITSCTPNIFNNGYNLNYTLNGTPGYATNYSWNGSNYTFNYVTPVGINSVNYNGFTQCNTPLSTQENLIAETIEAFPNPFYDKINITTSDINQTCVLYNNFGQIIFSGKNIDEHNFSGLVPGVYFLQIQEIKNVFKLIKYQ